MSTEVSKTLAPYQVVDIEGPVTEIRVGVGKVEVSKFTDPRSGVSPSPIGTFEAGETCSPGQPIHVRAVESSVVTWVQP